MIARDIMTTDIVCVRADTSAREIAQLLAGKGISAVPVVDENGTPIGVVSEGDLVGRKAEAREQRREWWLTMLAEGEELNPEYVASLNPGGATAASIMHAPVVTVSETTDVIEIARLLESYRIKRVPVIRDNRIVGIVSRADLVRALATGGAVAQAPLASGAAAAPAPPAPHHGAGRFLGDAIAALEERIHPHHAARAAPHTIAPATQADAAVSAQSFREVATQYRTLQNQRVERLRTAAAKEEHEQVRSLTEHHIDDAAWDALLARAHDAAQRGEKEFLLLRFPGELCADGGRAINAPSPDWPQTLRGEAAEIYLRWEHRLKAQGFHLAARVLEFPGGFPGDIGLFLSWNE